jgi:hypothetical protein
MIILCLRHTPHENPQILYLKKIVKKHFEKENHDSQPSFEFFWQDLLGICSPCPTEAMYKIVSFGLGLIELCNFLLRFCHGEGCMCGTSVGVEPQCILAESFFVGFFLEYAESRLLRFHLGATF